MQSNKRVFFYLSHSPWDMFLGRTRICTSILSFPSLLSCEQYNREFRVLPFLEKFLKCSSIQRQSCVWHHIQTYISRSYNLYTFTVWERPYPLVTHKSHYFSQKVAWKYFNLLKLVYSLNFHPALTTLNLEHKSYLTFLSWRKKYQENACGSVFKQRGSGSNSLDPEFQTLGPQRQAHCLKSEGEE